MFPRQNKLNPILADLKQLPGIESVQQDDFDSAGINVFLACKGTKYKLEQRTVDTKARIRKILKKYGYGFAFLDWPEKEYGFYSNPRRAFGGEDLGYPHRDIKIEIFV